MSQLSKGCGVCGSVASSEDHGYVITLGIEGITAFLPTKYAPDKGLRIGQPVETVIKASCFFVDEIFVLFVGYVWELFGPLYNLVRLLYRICIEQILQ